MTNSELINNWKNLSIQPVNSKELYKLSEYIMICWGETEVEMTNGNKEKIVIFDEGGPMKSSSLWCNSDEENNCWEFVYDVKKNKMEKENIGKFIRQ